MNTSTMTASIQYAVFLNNKGTRLVRQCQYGSAMKSFTDVLEILKPLAVIAEDHKHKHSRYQGDDNDNDNDNDNSIVTNTDDASSATNSVPLTISFTNKSMESRTSSSSLDKDVDTDTASTIKFRDTQKRRHFVFRDPVVIPPESCIPSSASASSKLLSKFLMIVMYNVALTFHLHALSLIASSSSSSSSSSSIASSSSGSNKKKKKNAKKLFSQSKKIYELALKMHLELDDDVDPLFTLALTNNLGLIYRTMNKKSVRCTICFQNMFSTMMYLLDSHSYHEDSSTTTQSINKDIWDGLLSNAMNILFKHTYDVAAAAA